MNKKKNLSHIYWDHRPVAIYLVPTPRWRDHKASGAKSARVIRVNSAAKPDKNSDKIIRASRPQLCFLSVEECVCVSGCQD